MPLNDTIHAVSAVEFFQFRKNAAVFLCNGGVFQQDLTEKWAHVYRMVSMKKPNTANIQNYLKSMYYAEMIQLKGTSYVWVALEQLTEKPHMAYTFPEAAEEVKRISKVFSDELEVSFPDQFTDVNDTKRYARLKREMLEYSEKLRRGEKASLDSLHDFFFNEIQYININPDERDSFETTYNINFTRWHQALGWKSAEDLKGVTAFEFFVANQRAQEANKQHTD